VEAVSPMPEPPPKKDVMLALLERSSVFIHLDPRKEEVRVPPWFKKQPQLVLQVGLNMAVRIPDLEVGDDGVGCTLSFNRSPVYCYMPWTSVFALVADDGKGMIWPNDIPKEVAAQQAERAQKEQAKAEIRSVPALLGAKPATKPSKVDAAKGKKRAPARLRAQKPPADGKPAPAPADDAPSAPSRSNGVAGVAGAAKRPLPSYLRVVK
jgi:stringent starvation protein B